MAIILRRGMGSLPKLEDVGPVDPEAAPSLSIIVAARDEARHIAEAVNSLLSQRYGPLEVIALNDRSRDGTGAILERLAEGREVRAADAAADNPTLRVLHIDELPAGWLGKNHALQRGADVAEGDLLLFTDADVMMRPDAVARAVGLLERERLDHLAVAPRLRVGSPAARSVVAVFMMVFSTFFRPWKARDPKSRSHIGIGAFNLVRSEAYRSIGGHGSVRLRPDDDVRLGRRLKESGYRQAAASGAEHLDVEWYPTLGAMARGLRKNAFAVVDYRLSLIAISTLLPLVFIFWPIAALFLTSGLTWWLNAAIVATAVIITTDTARANGLPLWTGPAYPLGSLLLLGIVWAASLRAVRRGTVEWRGTEYSLEELRAGSFHGTRRADGGDQRKGR